MTTWSLLFGSETNSWSLKVGILAAEQRDQAKYASRLWQKRGLPKRPLLALSRGSFGSRGPSEFLRPFLGRSSRIHVTDGNAMTHKAWEDAVEGRSKVFDTNIPTLPVEKVISSSWVFYSVKCKMKLSLYFWVLKRYSGAEISGCRLQTQ